VEANSTGGQGTRTAVAPSYDDDDDDDDSPYFTATVKCCVKGRFHYTECSVWVFHINFAICIFTKPFRKILFYLMGGYQHRLCVFAVCLRTFVDVRAYACRRSIGRVFVCTCMCVCACVCVCVSVWVF
jgi:hypothetical protein